MGSAGMSGLVAPSPSGKEVNEGCSGECAGGGPAEEEDEDDEGGGGCCVSAGLEPSKSGAAGGGGPCGVGEAASSLGCADDIACETGYLLSSLILRCLACVL